LLALKVNDLVKLFSTTDHVPTRHEVALSVVSVSLFEQLCEQPKKRSIEVEKTKKLKYFLMIKFLILIEQM
jgi:hypothetical protein